MLIEKHGSIRLRDVSIPQHATPEQQELAKGMVRVNHLYRSALKVAVAQLEILDEEFASLYDHTPIHHIEYRIKTFSKGSIIEIAVFFAIVGNLIAIKVIRFKCHHFKQLLISLFVMFFVYLLS